MPITPETWSAFSTSYVSVWVPSVTLPVPDSVLIEAPVAVAVDIKDGRCRWATSLEAAIEAGARPWRVSVSPEPLIVVAPL